jgi:prepilin-type N-terminal cleavage/methylation domain-containing protein
MIKKDNKKAFTLLELVFVIVVIGIMAGVGSSAFKPKYLIDDTNFIVAKIKEAQYKGIGFERLDFNGGAIGGYNNVGCITLTRSSLEENATNIGEVNYKLHVTNQGGDKDWDFGIICFDSKGRPHESSFNGTLIETQRNLTLTYSGEDKTITIQPITGYVTIR